MAQLTVIQEFPAPGRGAADLAWGAGLLWNADFASASIFGLDKEHVQIQKKLHCPGRLSGLTWGEQVLWQVVHGEGQIFRINPATRDIDQMLWVKEYGWLAGLTWDGQRLWVVAQQQGKLLGINPESGQVERQLPIPVAGGGLDYAGGYFWLGFPNRMIFDASNQSFEWVGKQPAYALGKISAEDGQLVEMYELNFLPMGVVWVEGRVWLTNSRAGTLSVAKIE